MFKPCRRCGTEFEPTAAAVRLCRWVCRSCRLEWQRSYNGVKNPRGPAGHVIQITSPEDRLARRRATWRRYNDKRKASPAHQLRLHARQLARDAIRAGRLVRQPCEVCGQTSVIHAHHDDYTRPLDVRWLCLPHHVAAHGGQF